MVPTPSAPAATTNGATNELPHSLAKITRHEGVQERVDSGVEVRDEEREGGKEGGERAATIVIGRPILPHLAGVVWQVAEREGEDDHHQHAYDAATRSQYVLRGGRVVGLRYQRRAASRGLATEHAGGPTATRTSAANPVDCDLAV